MSRSRETRDFSLSAASVCTIHSTRRRSHRRSRYMSDLGVRSSSAESTRCSSFSPLARPFSASQTGTYVQRHIRLNYSNTATNAFTDISLIMSTVSATNSPLSFSGTFWLHLTECNFFTVTVRNDNHRMYARNNSLSDVTLTSWQKCQNVSAETIHITIRYGS